MSKIRYVKINVLNQLISQKLFSTYQGLVITNGNRLPQRTMWKLTGHGLDREGADRDIALSQQRQSYPHVLCGTGFGSRSVSTMSEDYSVSGTVSLVNDILVQFNDPGS